MRQRRAHTNEDTQSLHDQANHKPVLDGLITAGDLIGMQHWRWVTNACAIPDITIISGIYYDVHTIPDAHPTPNTHATSNTHAASDAYATSNPYASPYTHR